MRVALWFAISSTSVAVLFVIAAFVDYNAEWRGLQIEYQQEALSKERVFSVRELLQDMEIGVKQEYLEGLGRIDRCTSCHLGMENPKMKGEPEPFTSHPGKLLWSHPPQKFGCTVCHGGQGLATTAEAAHGHVSNWHEPLRDPLQIEASCGMCHRGEDLPGTDHLNLGRKLFVEYGCVGCHTVRGRGQSIGPDLTVLAHKDATGDHRVTQDDWQWNIQHLLDPQSKVPASFMPRFGFDRPQAVAVTVFLYSLAGDVSASGYLPLRHEDLAPTTRVEAGRRVFVEFGCAGCHGRDGEGGHANPNSQSGGQVPALSKVKEGYLRAELIARIEEGVRTQKADPKGAEPPLNMPAWKGHISSPKLDLLVDYLFSLAPETEEDDWDD